jgi:transposase
VGSAPTVDAQYDRTRPPITTPTPDGICATQITNADQGGVDVPQGGDLPVPPQHRAVEFRKFLDAIDATVPAELAVHVVLDNSSTHKTPAIHHWLLRHPRFHFHFTPTSSSWLNLVERWFAELTRKMLKRSAHRSVTALTDDLNRWITQWNNNPRPFVWHKTADEILEALKKYLTNL